MCLTARSTSAGRPQTRTKTVAEYAKQDLERALDEADRTLCERRGHLLCLLVQTAVVAGDLARGQEALRTLTTYPQMPLAFDESTVTHTYAACTEQVQAAGAPILNGIGPAKSRASPLAQPGRVFSRDQLRDQLPQLAASIPFVATSA